LAALGLEARVGALLRAAEARGDHGAATALVAGAERLVDPAGMGTQYQCMAMVPCHAPPPPGFETAAAEEVRNTSF
jgi:hypothetical protein